MRSRFFFDYVDPASWLMERRLAELERKGELRVERHPYEIRPPPEPLVDMDDPAWRRRWREDREAAAAEGLVLARPRLVPWSRKAHELALHALERGKVLETHHALFEAFLAEGLDVGRVDVLVALAERLGMDRTETKAVLDVDRHAGEVARLRQEAERLGVRGVPTLLAEGRRLEGLVDRATVFAFLCGPEG